MQRLIMLALSLVVAPAPVIAAPNWVMGSATFERPVRSDKPILDGESVWHCQDATCRGRAPGHLKSAQRYCRDLARWGGPVTSFQAGALAFDAEALRRCNGGR
jgi:hypothetical protein